jgi:hypothetical protein
MPNGGIRQVSTVRNEFLLAPHAPATLIDCMTLTKRRTTSIGLAAAVASTCLLACDLATAAASPPAASAVAQDAQSTASFPMKGEDFVARVNERLAQAEAQLEAKLAKSKASESDKAEVRRRFKSGVAKVRSAAQAAAADGTVTREEAKQVRALARELRSTMRGA